MVKSKVEIFFIMRSEQAIEEIKKLIKENRTIFLILDEYKPNKKYYTLWIFINTLTDRIIIHGIFNYSKL